MATDNPDRPAPDPSTNASPRQWHRVFGLALVDLFADAPWVVELELELELALKSQLLDVAIIEARAPSRSVQSSPELPDGLENLRPHNLLTYKSHHEALSAWVLDELISHYVNYRKLKSLMPRASAIRSAPLASMA
jgi:hypothetical protein